MGKQDVETVEIPEWEPIPVTPTPQPTFQPQPTPTPVPTPVPTPERTYSELTEEEKIFVSTVCGESIGEGELSWQLIANVIVNRKESKHWSQTTIADIIAETGFNAYRMFIHKDECVE